MYVRQVVAGVSRYLAGVFFHGRVQICQIQGGPFLPFRLGRRQLAYACPSLLRFLQVASKFFCGLASFFYRRVPSLRLLILSFRFRLIRLSDYYPSPSSLRGV